MSNNIGDRYIALVTAHGWTQNYVYTWNGTGWDEYIPTPSDVVYIIDMRADYTFYSGGWSGPGLGAVDFGFQLLTPMKKKDRVSRVMNSMSFSATPGIWAVLNNDGTLSNVTESASAKINKLVIGFRSGNIYETHDTDAGTITTIEDIGIRCKISYNLYVGVINAGDRLIVSTYSDTLGKLISAEQGYELGDYEVVAIAEEVHITEGWLIFQTISPTMITLV